MPFSKPEAYQQKAFLIESLQKFAKIGAWELDLTSMTLAWSDEVYKIHELPVGHPPEIDKALNFYHPSSRPIITKAVNEAIELGKSYDLELSLITAKDNIKWVRAIGLPQMKGDEVSALIGLFQDIDDQKRIEEQLMEQKRMLDLALDISAIGVWNWDISSETLHWNKQMHKIFDWHEDQFEGKFSDFSDRLHPEDVARVLEAVQVSIAEKKKYDIEYRVLTQNHDERIVRAEGEVSFDRETQSPLRMIGTCLDVTMQRNGEMKLKKINNQLTDKVKELKQLNEELESFTYSVSHDLRAPLRAINGFAQAIAQECANALSEDNLYYFSRIISNSEKMGELIDGLLEFSRTKRKIRISSSFDPNTVIDEIIENYFSESRAEFKIDKLPMINGDKEMLGQVFHNLISNAEKYSSKEDNPIIQIKAEKEEGCIILIFSDNGVGFDMAYSDELFKIFHRLHSDTEFPGTGIGLALCQKIVVAHGGDIWADSMEQKGSTFFVKLKA